MDLNWEFCQKALVNGRGKKKIKNCFRSSQTVRLRVRWKGETRCAECSPGEPRGGWAPGSAVFLLSQFIFLIKRSKDITL